MLGSLTKKFQDLFAPLLKKRKLTEENITNAMSQVRLALLDADVHYPVVTQFVQRVKEKALGSEVLKSITPGQQFIKLVHDELTAFMGHEEALLDLHGKISVLLLCGLQGSGKTTSCVKLAAFIRKQEKQKKVLLAACDVQRPAACEQLQKLGAEAGFPVFVLEGERNPIRVAQAAHERAKLEGYDVLIIDTAGRVHLDVELMQELVEMKALLHPREVLFVASAATGQDAVRTALAFDQKLQITGTVLTMLDGNARAGAAISIREVTKKPLKFEGIGERVEDLQVFHPRSMADRILGMGDTINLVKKAEEHFSEQERQDLEQKMRRASFTYADYLQQIKMLKKMGSLQSMLKMLTVL